MTERIDSLRKLVETQRSRWQRLRLLEALGWAVSGALAYFLAVVLLDNVAHLPVWGRLTAAGGLLAVMVVLGRRLATRWRERHASEDEIALTMERRTAGGVQNRLINALQIGRDAAGGSTELGEALVRENCRHLSDRPLEGAVAVRPAILWLALSAGLAAIVAAGWLWQPQRFGSSAARILLPFASIDPVFRTVLVVEPGDIETAGDVEIRVRIKGERPAELAILLDERERRSTQIVPVTGDTVTYTLRKIEHSLAYAVRGGDFTSPYYRIEVPTPARLSRVQATYEYPAYTKLPEKTFETGGDLEALAGARGKLVFYFDHGADEATLIVRGGAASAVQRSELKRHGPKEFSGEVTFDNLVEYSLETRQADRPPHASPWYNIRVVEDDPPHAELTGLPTSGEVSIDAALPLLVTASDDLALKRSGLFVRRAAHKSDEEQGEDDWTEVQVWAADGEKQSENSAEFSPASIGAAEGERVELVARAGDLRPDREESWTSGPTHVLLVAGDGAQLQILYEQILKSEAELSAVATLQQQLHAVLDGRVRKLDADPAADGNDTARVQEILAEAARLSREHDQLRQTAVRVAKEMVPPAGSLRLSIRMLADSEMIRAIRALESVATRDDAAGRRAALAEARATAQRTWQSEQQILEQYVRFRQEWELAHMTPFLRMLADRQALLRDQSQRWVEAPNPPSDAQRETAARRQAKLTELCGLAETAFAGLAERTQEVESLLSEAFAETSNALGGDELRQPQQAAQAAAGKGEWSVAAQQQTLAAEILDQIYTRLHEAQAEAARRVLAALDDHDESDLAGQAALEKLKEGYSEDLLDEPDGLKLEDILHMAEVTQAKKNGSDDEKPFVNDYLFPDSAVPGLQGADKGIRQEFKNLSLANAPGKTPSFPSQSDRKGNRVKPHIQEKFEDLVGDLLEEEDEMNSNYETFNLNAAFNINEKGDVAKQGGDLNSTAASAATGNQKPPTTNVGGASRIGRQGARAHGVAVGNESINRRGRDKVQEGQDRVPDQADTVKQTMSDDPQEDTSTGVGGRKIESDDTKFSLSDSGEWTDDMADRMEKPQEKQSIVERQVGKLDASVGEMLRDMNSKQEQIIERVKSIRKELKNLYLPTEHLDQLLDQMQANLHSLNERPSVEVFRMQQETLEQLRGTLQVFHQAHSGFQASLQRDQVVRGRVLDDPARSAPPGYEEAVKTYYQRLASPGNAQ